jgi:hypothetical protein
MFKGINTGSSIIKDVKAQAQKRHGRHNSQKGTKKHGHIIQEASLIPVLGIDSQKKHRKKEYGKKTQKKKKFLTKASQPYKKLSFIATVPVFNLDTP